MASLCLVHFMSDFCLENYLLRSCLESFFFHFPNWEISCNVFEISNFQTRARARPSSRFIESCSEVSTSFSRLCFISSSFDVFSHLDTKECL